MLLITMKDDMGAFQLALQMLISENAGELEDGVFEGIEATHLQIDPQKLRLEGEYFHYLLIIDKMLNQQEKSNGCISINAPPDYSL